MSELLTSASRALGIPEPLVQRSAEARAQATGASVEEVLQAWAGGGSVAAPPKEEAPAAEPEEAPAEPAPQPEPAAPQPEPAAVPAPAAAAAVMVEEAPPPVEAAPLGDRVRVAARIGAGAGLAMSLLVMLASAVWLLPKASVSGVEGAFRPTLELVPGWLIVGHGLIAAAVGGAVGVLTRAVTGWRGSGMRLVSSKGMTVAVGAVAGLVMGALTGAVIAGSGSPSEVVEGAASIPVMGGLLWLLAGWVATGWVIGAATQVMGVPEGVESEEAHQVGEVSHRLTTAVSVPVAAAIAILVLVLPVAYLFISFPSFAPLLGVFVAASILGFAGLSASRPSARIGLGELFAALAGIGVVVVIVVAVLIARGAGHGEGEAPEGGEEAAAVLVVS